VLSLLLIQTVHAEKYPDKQVLMNISKGDMVYCAYGNKDKPTAICDSIELKSSFMLLDRFLEILEYGPSLESEP
jgi:hypothetical protein